MRLLFVVISLLLDDDMMEQQEQNTKTKVPVCLLGHAMKLMIKTVIFFNGQLSRSVSALLLRKRRFDDDRP